jgi:hypothetical protein
MSLMIQKRWSAILVGIHVAQQQQTISGTNATVTNERVER